MNTPLINIAIAFHSVPDPYHLAGSGSTSENVDPDPGSK